MKKIRVSTYTDESGQDTKGELFVVCTVITLSSNSEQLEKDLNSIESKTNKKYKWYESKDENRKNYIRHVTKLKSTNKFQIYYSIFNNKLDYSNLLGSHIAKSIINFVGENEYKAKIFIDKTNNKVIEKIKNEIKLYRIKYQKIRGLSDDSSSIIRLADSSCGMIRDIDKNKSTEYKLLFRKFKEV